LCPAKKDLIKKGFCHESGHNWRDFASDEPVTAAIFNVAVKKGMAPERHGPRKTCLNGDGSNAAETFDETCEE
jgi:hypothetical protein